MQDIYTKIFTSKKFWKFFIPVFLFVLVSGGLFLLKNKPQIAEAGWWNENWTYRKAVPVSNDTTTESNVYVSITLDTSASTTIQSDCGDFRFTSESGDILPYYVVSGCGTATTVVHVYFSTFLNGSHVIFFYYGNPSVEDGFSASDFSTVATSYTVGTVGVEEIGLGPVAYWPFEKGYGTIVYDESSGGNDGTITGATWQDESMCVSGKCLYFDGVNDELDMGSGSSIDGVFENGGTMNFWLKLSGWGELDPIIINKANNSTTGGWRFNIATSSRYFYFEQNHSSNIGEWRTKTNFVELNKWYFISLSYDSSSTSNKPALYVDGINQSLTTISSPLGTADSDDIDNLVIGNNSGTGTDNSYEGYLDEVKIYPYTRTADQIKQDYNAGLSGVGSSKGIAVSFGSASDFWMSDGLVGYWKMDETATTSGAIDSSGNGNDGTYYNSASTTGGKFGNGGVFDGTGDYVDMRNGSSTGDVLDLLENFSISSWVKVSNAPSAGNAGACIVCKGTSSGGPALQYGFYVDDSLKIIVSDWLSPSSNSIETNRWYNITAVYGEAGTKPQLFVDGENWSIGGGGITPIHLNYDLTVGAVSGFNIYHPFDGQIDEVRIYNRALSSSEVKKLYEWAPGPVLHLKMDEKQGTTAYDTSGNGNDGTLTNGPIWARGKYGSAINLDKSDDYIEVINSTPVTLNNSLTIQLWVKLNALPTSDYTVFVEKGNYSDGYLFSTGSGSMTDLSFWYAGFSADTGEILNIGEWQNIAVTYDGANVVFYHDGINIYSIAKTGSATGNTDNITIGKSVPWGSTRNFNGSVDDLKIYNYARTQKQILEDMGGGHPAQKSPVAYYKFDKGYGATVYDWSGNGNDGTASSSNSGTNANISQMWSLDGKLDKAMEFDGVDDYVDVSVVLDSINTGDLSISLWFNPTATFSSPTTSSARLFSFADAASTNDASLSLDNTTGKMRFVMFDSVGGERVTSSSRDVWIEGTWYHALATYSSILGRKLYIDGVLEGVNENTSRGATMATNASIGNRGYLSNWNFYGLIDEVKIFNYALSDDEIKIEYNRTATQMGVKNVDSSGIASNSASKEYCVPGDTATCSSPVLELKLDEKQGTTAFDTSGNGGNGTFTGTTTPSWTRGKTGSALDFIANGVDYDYLSVSDSTILTNIFTTGASVSFWINPRSDGFTNGAIVAKRRWLITLTGQSAGKAKLYFEITGNTDKGKWTTTNTVINLNSWNFVSLTYTYASSAVQPVVMVNGKKALLSSATTPLGAYTSDSGENIFVGAEDGAGLASFDGLIDNVKIFNYIRTPAQSAWDYNRGKASAYYRFDECEGSTIYDWSENNNNGTTTIGVTGTQTALGNCTTASTTTAWYNGRSGRINSALNFDGTDDYISVGDIGMNINSISFWSKQSNANNYFIDLDGGTNTITLSSSELSTTGISAPAYYIDGIEDRSIPDNSWHHITIVTDTSINVSNLVIGKIGANYYNGLLDEIKLYNYALTEEQIKLDYNNGTVKFGG